MLVMDHITITECVDKWWHILHTFPELSGRGDILRSAHFLESPAPSRLWRRHFIRLLVRVITLYVSNICTAHYIRHWLMLLNTTNQMSNQMHAVRSWSLSVTCVLPFLSFPDRFVSDFLWASNIAGSTEYKHSVHLPYRAQTFFLLDRHTENVAMYWCTFFYAFGNILDVLREH